MFKNKGMKTQYSKHWINLMRGENGKLSQRVLDDECEKQFWKDYLKKPSHIKKDSYSLAIEKKVIDIMGRFNPEDVLEIGPGWGNYTEALSQNCKNLTCMDISPDILDFLEKQMAGKGRKNICWICKKLEDAALDKQYDMVFAYNCFYRMVDIISCLKKIDRLSKGIVLIGMNGNLQRGTLDDFEKKLGLKVKKNLLEPDLLHQILKEIGIHSRLIKFQIPRNYAFEDLEKAYEYEKTFILSEEYDQDEVKKIVFSWYVDQNRMKVQAHKINAGLILWKKNKEGV